MTTKVLFLPGEMNFKLLRALSIKWHMDTFAKLPVQGIATCCCRVNSPYRRDDNPIPCLRLAEYICGKQRPGRAHGRGSRWRPRQPLAGGVARFT